MVNGVKNNNSDGMSWFGMDFCVIQYHISQTHILKVNPIDIMLSINRLRVLVLIQFTLALIHIEHTLYRLHYFHLLLQPFIFVATVYSGKWIYPAYFSMAVVSLFDSIVFIPSFTAAMRCLADVSPMCVEQNVNLFPLAIVSLTHIFIDWLQFSNLRLVKTAKYAIDHKERLRIITWFLFVQDTVCTYSLASQMNSFLLIYHPVFNFGVFWVTGLYQTNQEKTINIIGVVAVFIFIVDIINIFWWSR